MPFRFFNGRSCDACFFSFLSVMAEKKQIPPPPYDLNAKWDACSDLALRRVFYSSFAGAGAGLLLFRSPMTRWACVAFGAGVGIGTAYTECSLKFDGSPAKLPPVPTSPSYHERK